MWRRLRVSEAPSVGVWRIYVAMWDCMRVGGREGEGEREREGEGEGGERNNPSSKPLDKHSTFRQNHSINTGHQSIDTTTVT